MSFSDEEIIAYLLGDADSSLAENIKAALSHDGELAQRLTHFRQLLGHLDGLPVAFEPPNGLVERAMEFVEQLQVPTQLSDAEQPHNVDGFNSHLVGKRSQSKEGLVQTSSQYLTSLADKTVHGRSWLDSAALTVSLIVLCSLMIPAVLRARYEARKLQCANNLSETGQLLFQYAIRQSNQRFPHIAKSGPEAFSGMFVVRLQELGLAPRPNTLKCASLLQTDDCSTSLPLPIPTLREIQVAANDKLHCWKCKLGGDYAYNLGVIEDDDLVAPRHHGNSHFAILADAPLFNKLGDQLLAHEGAGINILFDDGHVRFVTSQNILHPNFVGDHPFRNLLGAHEAGVISSDASLAPSQFPPIADAAEPIFDVKSF